MMQSSALPIKKGTCHVALHLLFILSHVDNLLWENAAPPSLQQHSRDITSLDETCPRGMRGRGDNGLDNQLNLSPLCPYSSNRPDANLHAANNQLSGESRMISIILLSGTPAFEGETKIG